MIWYALAIFWSAFLLFLVQPILGKQILPWFGGTPGVWTTCLLFFQILLLGGYMYAHASSAWLKPRGQALLHVTLLTLSLWFLPIVADPAYRTAVDAAPTWQILSLLAFTIGAPYFLISATGPLLQAWFAHTHSASPYRLYALSNVGSLLALLSYPFLVEPNLRLGAQTTDWSWGYVLFVVACGLCAAQLAFSSEKDRAGSDQATSAEHVGGDDERDQRPTAGLMALWLGLASTASAMLMATTNQICQEVAVVPFLWILPLTLYLLSFIICFDSPRWYDRRVFLPLLVLSVVAATEMLFLGVNAPILAQIGTSCVALFATAMVCHGELVRSKPTTSHLTLFYLFVATGGAVGGVLVAIIAPRLFTGFWEYHLSLVAGCLLAVLALAREPGGSWQRRPNWLTAVLLLGFLALGAGLTIHSIYYNRGVVYASRNFYGLLRVRDAMDTHTDPQTKEVFHWPVRKLVHGAIWHGMQWLDEDKQRWPTSYYSPHSGVGIAIQQHPRRNGELVGDTGLHIGIVGLGTGTVAALGQRGDRFRFYEINPDVIHVAQEYFTYLSHSDASSEVVEGDARLMLEKELESSGPHLFDILVMDAFSSDAIPMHLLTTECVDMYWKHLKPDGILIVNILNRNVDLQPIIRAIADHSHREARVFHENGNASRGLFVTSWAIVTSNREFLDSFAVAAGAQPLPEDLPDVVWTDDYGSLWQVLRRFELPNWETFQSWIAGIWE